MAAIRQHHPRPHRKGLAASQAGRTVANEADPRSRARSAGADLRALSNRLALFVSAAFRRCRRGLNPTVYYSASPNFDRYNTGTAMTHPLNVRLRLVPEDLRTHSGLGSSSAGGEPESTGSFCQSSVIAIRSYSAATTGYVLGFGGSARRYRTCLQFIVLRPAATFWAGHAKLLC